MYQNVSFHAVAFATKGFSRCGAVCHCFLYLFGTHFSLIFDFCKLLVLPEYHCTPQYRLPPNFSLKCHSLIKHNGLENKVNNANNQSRKHCQTASLKHRLQTVERLGIKYQLGVRDALEMTNLI